MAIPLTCSGCDTDFSVPDTLAGKWIKCKSCGTAVEVPAAEAVPTRPASRPPTKAASRPVRAAAVIEDDDYDDAGPPSRRPAAAKGGSKLPLILAAVGAFVVVGGGLTFALTMMGGGDKEKEVVVAPPVKPAQVDPPADKPAPDKEPEKGTEKATDKPASEKPPAKTETAAPGTKPADPPKASGTGLVAPLSPGAVAKSDVPAAALPTKADIDQISLDKCKQAAVYIHCEDVKGRRSTGSGWFGLEPNLIFTNAHVISMLAPGTPKPKKLTAFVNPGTPQQKEIPHNRIEILAVDRKMDLALLRVLNETGLPPPLVTRMSSSLRDLERLVVLGYPLGAKLAEINKSTKHPTVTVNETKVMNLRRDTDGNLYTVQVSGGMVWGNSGGPIVDADGRVVAVSVRVDITNGGLTGIAYGVPTEFVNGLLAGRIGEIEFGVPYKDGKGVKVPVTVNCLDPLNRLKSVGIACWVGEESKSSRPAGTTKPTPETGDTDYLEVPLKYTYAKDKQVAVGELSLPEASAGRVYWVQPYYGNQVEDRYWLAGNPLRLISVPVERTAVELSARFKPGTQRTLTLSNKNSLIEFEDDEGADRSERLLINTLVKGREVQLSPERGTDFGALYRMKFDSVGMSAELGLKKQDNILPKEIRKLFAQGIKLCEGAAWVAKTGEVVRTQADVRNPGLAPYNSLYKDVIIDPVMDSLMAASVRLPNKKVEPGETWKQTKQVRLAVQFDANAATKKGDDDDTHTAQRPGQPAKKNVKIREYKYQEEIVYKYVGLRTRQGVKEAVLEVSGAITTPPGTSEGNGATGRVKGYAFLDLDTGTVVKAEVDREFEVDVSADGIKRRLSGVNTYSIDRGPTTAGSN